MTFALITFLLLPITPLPQVEATTLDEQAVQGELVSLTSESLALRTPSGDIMLPVEKLLSVTPTPAPNAAAVSEAVRVELADGSLIAAGDYQVKAGKATIKLAGEKTVSLSAGKVRSVRFLEQDENVAQLWQKIAAGELKGDAVVVRKGGGGQPARLDYLEGVIQDVSPAAVQFNFEGDLVPVNRSRVQIEGLIYFQKSQQNLPKAVCRVVTQDGSRWMASQLRVEQDQLKLTTATGADVILPLGDVAAFDFSLGKIAYLSDLTPIKKHWQPFLAAARSSASVAQMFDVRRDTGFSGGLLRLGEQTFRKGLALHSRTEITYRLPGEYSRLQAVADIDPSQRNYGNVQLSILGDGKKLYDKNIAGDDPPTSLEIDIRGVGRLTVLVDYGQGLDIGDQLILGGVRVIR